MNDLIKELASDPSCLLAITPEAGGSWLAPFRTRQPRNFAEEPKTWTVFLQKLSEIALDDCEINLKLVPLQLSSASAFWGIYFSSNNTSLVVNSGTLTDNPLAVIITPVVEKPTSIVIKRVGNSVEIICDEISKGTRSGNANDLSAAELGNALSEFHGYLLNASLINLTTSETVWQAAYSDLYDTSNPWPSSVLRNFAEEPMTWWDEKTTAPAIAEDDCDFFIRYRLDGYPEGSVISQIFYHNSQNGSINIAFAGNGTGGNYSVIRLTAAGAFVIPLDRVRQLGEHTIRIQRIGQTVTVEFDGEIVATSTGAEKVAVYSTTAPVSDFDGVIFETYWKSLTTGRTVWRYPSEAERVRLITKTNVRTDRGAFEAADENTIAGVATQLDLRGNATSKTFIVRAFCPAHDPASGKLYIHPFFGQGAISQSASLYTFQFSLWEDRRSGRTTQLFPAISTGTDTPGANVTGAEIYLDQWHTYAMVIDCNGGNCYIRAFVDGVLLRERTVSGTPAWNTSATTTAQETTVGIRRDPNASYFAGSLTRISAALVFDRALSAEEIALYSKIANS